MGQVSGKGDSLLAYKTTTDENEHPISLSDKTIGDTLIRWKHLTLHKRQKILSLAHKGIYTLTPNISLFIRLKTLDLSNNYLRELPEAIACLGLLEQLSLTHNRLSHLPDSLCRLSRLKELDLSHNCLSSISPYLGHLSHLQSLQLNHNTLSQLPFVLHGLTSLILLDLSHNPISVLPAQIVQLPYLRRFRLEGCPLATDIEHIVSYDPPSLVEICARSLVTFKIPFSLPDPLQHFFATYHLCDHCRAPYFNSFVQRVRWLDRNELWIPLEYRLCSAHWSHEPDRLLATFAQSFIPHTLSNPFHDSIKRKHKMQATLKTS